MRFQLSKTTIDVHRSHRVLLRESSLIIKAEQSFQSGEVDEGLSYLRCIGLEDWGDLLWSLPRADLPGISAQLPSMSSKDVQEAWTGSSGQTLLGQTIPFVRYLLQVGGPFNIGNQDFKALDYGCGYGRISRLILKYVSMENLYGADPWEESIAHVNEAGFGLNFQKTEEVPSSLPFRLENFNLIWAFSVFTHLAPQVAKKSIETISKYLKENGTFVLTIRPIEYWEMRSDLPKDLVERMRTNHLSTGCAFQPHNRNPLPDFGIPYGDSSMSIEYLESISLDWKIIDIDRMNIDPYQLYVTLKKKST